MKLEKNSLGGPVNSGAIDDIVVHSVGNQSIECSSAGCTNFTVVRFRVQEKGDYYIRLDWGFTSTQELPVSKLQFTGYTMNFGNAIATGIVKIFLLVYTIVDFAFYCCNLRRAKIRANEQRKSFTLTFEQKFLVLLNVAMLLFFDPIGIAHAFAPTVFTYGPLTQVCMVCTMERYVPQYAGILLASDVCGIVC